MRHILFYFIACLTLSSAIAGVENNQSPAAVAAPLKVLFIGNSYTFVNDLPALLTELAASAHSPHRIQTQMIAEPSATLQLLWEKGSAKKAIQDNKWDFVVLQEQSILPTLAPEQMRIYAKKFDDIIKSQGAKTVLFITWARRGKPEMQPKLNHAYLDVAKELGAKVAPVGQAWAIALAAAPATRLYMDDDSHPAVTGSYLAACVFYQVMLGEQLLCPPSKREGISNEEAETARNAASQAVAKIH